MKYPKEWNEMERNMSGEDIIKSVTNRVEGFHPVEPIFQEVIEEHFDDLICPVEEDPLKDLLKDQVPDQVPKVFTSYYSNPYLRKLSQKDVSKISISIHPPKGWKEKGGLHYLPLCPTEKIFWEVKSTGNQQEYVRQLLEQFDRLNPQKVYSDLMEMSGGKPVVLLCYERPVPTVGDHVYCHRQVVSEWFGSNGIVVPELTEKHVQSLSGSDEISLF